MIPYLFAGSGFYEISCPIKPSSLDIIDSALSFLQLMNAKTYIKMQFSEKISRN